MRVLFHMLTEAGHLNPVFPIARALVARGHEVVFTSALDFQREIEARGFRFAPIHRDIIPRGRLGEIERLETDDERNDAWNVISDRIHEEYFDGTIEACVREVDPCVVMADVITRSALQFVAHRLGIPCVQLSTHLSQRHDEHPPVTTPFAPGVPKLVVDAARWEASCLRFSVFDRVSLTPLISSVVHGYSSRFGYPSEQVSFKSTFCPTLTLFPEAVLCASAFDYPRPAGDGPLHLAAPLELDRHEDVPESLERFVDRDRPLVYASLGSQSGRYAERLRFFGSVLDAMREHPDWHAVIVAGPRDFDHPIFENPPSNVLRLDRSPQLWILQRAAVFVTHAGLGGIREAIALGVPMIAVPQQLDQPGNASRIAYHGLGLAIPAEALTGNRLRSAIESVLKDASRYKACLRRIDEATRAEEAENRVVEIVERVARARMPGPIASHPSGGQRVESSPCLGWMFVAKTNGGAALGAGAQLHDPRADEPVGVGSVGFTICTDLAAALSRAVGPVVARVEVSDDTMREGPYVVGRKLRCLWVHDVSKALHDYAEWCAEAALESEREADPEAVGAFMSFVRQAQKLRSEGSDTGEIFLHAFACAAPRWYGGYGTAALATTSEPHTAARDCRWEGIQRLMRRHVPEAVGTPESATRYEEHYRLLVARFSAELERRIDEHRLATQP